MRKVFATGRMVDELDALYRRTLAEANRTLPHPGGG
jgi:hypothetical protein